MPYQSAFALTGKGRAPYRERLLSEGARPKKELAYICRSRASAVQQIVKLLTYSELSDDPTNPPRPYYYYVIDLVPEKHLDRPEMADRGVIKKYGIVASSKKRSSRKKDGLANVVYLRFERIQILMCQEGNFLPGEVDFIQHHKMRGKLRDARKHPLHFQDYVIPVVEGKDGKPHVSAYMAPKRYNQIKRKFHKMSLRASKKEIAAALQSTGYQTWAGVEYQLKCILEMVNERRKKHRMPQGEMIPEEALPPPRKMQKVFLAPGSPTPSLSHLKKQKNR